MGQQDTTPETRLGSSPADGAEGFGIRLRRRIRRWLPDVRIPRRIKFALYCSALSIGIGLYKGINLLVLVGYAVPVLVAFNVRAAARSLPRLTVRRQRPGPVFAGSACEVELHLHNTDRRPGLALQLEEHGPNHRFHWVLPALTTGSSARLRGKLVPAQRGLYSVSALQVYSGYPFGLVERRCVLAPGEEWIILPRLGVVHRPAFRRFLRTLAGHGDRVRSNPRRHPAARDEFHGLRPFRAGDSPRAIHWRTSARRNEWMVREYEDFAGENLVLVFDPGLPTIVSDPDRENFEAAVSFAASLAWEWCRRRGDRFVLAYFGSEPVLVQGLTGPELGRRALEELAVAEPRLPGPGPAALRSLGQSTLPQGPVVLVSTRGAHLAAAVRAVLRRSITVLDPAAGYDFYEPPHLLEKS